MTTETFAVASDWLEEQGHAPVAAALLRRPHGAGSYASALPGDEFLDAIGELEEREVIAAIAALEEDQLDWSDAITVLCDSFVSICAIRHNITHADCRQAFDDCRQQRSTLWLPGIPPGVSPTFTDCCAHVLTTAKLADGGYRYRDRKPSVFGLPRLPRRGDYVTFLEYGGGGASLSSGDGASQDASQAGSEQV